jgi:uracil-DNA glycosylase
LPPRPECAQTWHPRLIPLLKNVELTLLIGQYAQEYFLGDTRKATLTDTVRAWRDYAPRHIPMPHPSPRNQLWLKKNAWFERQCVPALRKRVHALLRI